MFLYLAFRTKRPGGHRAWSVGLPQKNKERRRRKPTPTTNDCLAMRRKDGMGTRGPVRRAGPPQQHRSGQCDDVPGGPGRRRERGRKAGALTTKLLRCSFQTYMGTSIYPDRGAPCAPRAIQCRSNPTEKTVGHLPESLGSEFPTLRGPNTHLVQQSGTLHLWWLERIRWSLGLRSANFLTNCRSPAGRWRTSHGGLGAPHGAERSAGLATLSRIMRGPR